MSDNQNIEMGKKRTRQQSSNVIVAPADSSESGDGAIDKTSVKIDCTHVAKSIDVNQIKKNIILYVNGKKQCGHCNSGNTEDEIFRNLEPNDDFYVCLRCGAKTCTIEHASLHYGVPRSDLHALTLKIPAFSVWCHACKTDIPSVSTKKLKNCIISIEQLYNKQINLQPLSNNQQESKNLPKNKDENKSTSNEDKSSEPIPLPPPKRAPFIAPANTPLVRGLTNLGNTCFFNSVLQCLAQTPGLVETIREMEKSDQHVEIALKSGTTLSGKLDGWDRFCENLTDTLVKLQCGGPVLTPDRLHYDLTKRQSQFEDGRQHDAHELLTYLIDSVRMTDHKRYQKLILSEFGLYRKQEQSLVPQEIIKKLKSMDYEVAEIVSFIPEKVFKGRLINRIECHECHSVKTFEESFLDLSLPIVPDKPQPPCMRRKGLQHQQNSDNFKEDNKKFENNCNNINNNSTMTKSQKRKVRGKQWRYKNSELANSNNNNNYIINDNGNNNVCKIEENDESPPALVEEVENLKEQQDSDVEGDVEDNSEETNCGSKGSNAQTAHINTSAAGDVINNISEKVLVEVDENSVCVSETENRKTVDKCNVTCGTTCNLDETCCDDTKSLFVENKQKSCVQLEGGKVEAGIEEENVRIHNNTCSSFYKSCSIDKKTNSDAQVTAWLNKSNLTNIHDDDDDDVTAEHQNIFVPNNVNEYEINDNNCTTQSTNNNNRQSSPQPQTSVYSNHPSSNQPSLDETRSSFLTVTQETQESGYCSEKLGCAESPQRGDSPCSCEGFSPAWTGVEGALSSRSDESIEEAINNTVVAETEENVNPETVVTATSVAAEVSTTLCNKEPISDDSKKSSLPILTTLESTNSTNAICNNWLEENSNIGTAECNVEKIVSVDSSLSNEAKKRRKGKIYFGSTCVKDLNDIPEEDVIFGPPNIDEISVTDSNLNNLPDKDLSGLTGSPEQEVGKPSTAEVSDRVDKELSKNNVHEAGSDNVKKSINEVDRDTSDKGLSCGCIPTTSKQDPSENCCLHTSLAQSTQVELMTGCNKIVCDHCTSGNPDGKSVYTNSTKQTLISQAPPALVIHLKRFEVQTMTCRKLSKHVSFPLQLDLTPYSIQAQNVSDENAKVDEMKRSNLYTLYGVVEHLGTMNGGHYVAYVKVTRDNTNLWYCISDSHVSQVTETRVLSAQAYLLFYKRINT